MPCETTRRQQWPWSQEIRVQTQVPPLATFDRLSITWPFPWGISTSVNKWPWELNVIKWELLGTQLFLSWLLVDSGCGKHKISLNQGLTFKELSVSMGRYWPNSRRILHLYLGMIWGTLSSTVNLDLCSEGGILLFSKLPGWSDVSHWKASLSPPQSHECWHFNTDSWDKRPQRYFRSYVIPHIVELWIGGRGEKRGNLPWPPSFPLYDI